MLNFVIERNQSPPKCQIPKLPHIDFGVSAQSPQFFHTPQAMLSNHSYDNPFVQIGQQTLQKSKCLQKYDRQQRWINRVNFKNHSQMKNQKGFLTSRNSEQQSIAPGLNHSIAFDQTFENYRDKIKSFHKKKGQFTTYLQNHIHNVDFIGPILGDQRKSDRNMKTKRKLLTEKFQKLERTKQKYSTIKQRRNLSPLLEKSRIHMQRKQLHDTKGEEYQAQLTIKERTTKQFQLPKINRFQLENSLSSVKQNYKKFKNQNLSFSTMLSNMSTQTATTLRTMR